MLLNPELRGKPIAVCGSKEKRHGIVLAKSYPAKECGVKTGDTVNDAERKCPGLIIVPPHFEKYSEYSEKVFNIYTEYTDMVESYGLDECWLDVTGSRKLFGDGKTIADSIRERVKERTGLTVSVGVSFTKTLAKLGSDIKKPDATTVITQKNLVSYTSRLLVEDMMMVGKAAARLLNKLNIRTIDDLARANEEVLSYHLGINGTRLIAEAAGRGGDTVRHYTDSFAPESVGHSTTPPKDIGSYQAAEVVIYQLAEMVATRLRKHGLAASGIHLWLRYKNLESLGRQRALTAATSSAHTIGAAGCKLMRECWTEQTPLRSLGITAIRLDRQETEQISFFEDVEEKESRLSKSLDEIRGKYGFDSITRGTVIRDQVIVDNLSTGNKFLPFAKAREYEF